MKVTFVPPLGQSAGQALVRALKRFMDEWEKDMRNSFVPILRQRFLRVANKRTGTMQKSIKVVREGPWKLGVTWVFYGDLVNNGAFVDVANKAWLSYTRLSIERASKRSVRL